MKYNKIISALQKAEPVLDKAEELTDRIMQNVEQMPVATGQNYIIRIAGIISGAAAAVLICLFAYGMLKFTVSPVVNHPEMGYLQTTSSSKIHPQEIAEFDIKGKEEIIETVIQSKKAQRMRKNEILLNHLNKK